MRRLLFAIILYSIAFAVSANGMDYATSKAALEELKTAYPGIGLYSDGDRVTRVYGQPFGAGSSAVSTAEQFRDNYTALFGTDPVNLRPGSVLDQNHLVQPVMYNSETGEYKFTLVYYSQYIDDIPVYMADLRLLVRNEPGYPLVLAASALRNLGDFKVDPSIARTDLIQVRNTFIFKFPNYTVFSEPRMVIWAGIDDMKVAPTAGVEFIASNGEQPTEKMLYIIEPVTGEVLYESNLIIEVDVYGHVDGNATDDFKADFCGPEVATPLPYSRVYINSNSPVFADANGDFVIPNGGSSPVTVYSHIRGQWFRAYNYAGGDAQLTQEVTPPGPADFLHNFDNSSEFNRAEVNAYYQANIVRDFALTYNPSYPVINNQTEFPVYVNRTDGYCPGNAWYNGSSINFCQSGEGYPNTAFADVVHHEYGHHLVNVGGSGQGAYGEGMSDVMALLILDSPYMGLGFFGNCNEPLRNADNSMQYPCSGGIHYCGQLLSGCVWDTREALAITNPVDYIDILSNIAVNAILLHTGQNIDPSITIDYLTLDDDDEFIENGTPHYNEICAGFNAHNMDCPEITAGVFISHTPLEDTPSSNPYEVDATIISTTGTVTSATLHWSTDGVNFTPESMQDMGNNLYNANIPGQQQCTGVYYYLQASDNQGYSGRHPETSYNRFFVGSSFITLFSDNFQTDQGWTVSGSVADGQWERAIPAGGGDRGDPPTDYDGSGFCYVTDNVDGNSDVDDGTTILTSPTFDLSEGDSKISYARWYSNSEGDDPNNDVFVVQVSSDNGGSWTVAETVGPIEESSGGWYEHSFWVGSFVTPSSQVKIRFEASDLGSGSIVEAGLDAFLILAPDCDPVQTGTLEGTVTDIYTNPISNVQVFAEDGLGNTGSASTNGSGFYTMSLVPGTYEVSFSHPNYTDLSIPDVVITEDVTTVQDAVLEEDTTEVPTLSEWGMILLSLLLLAMGTIAVVRRRQTLEAGTN